MGMRIWKYPLQLLNYQSISMPAGAEILTVQAQNETPCLWAKIDPTGQPVFRTILILRTGHSLPEYHGRYLGTFQLRDVRLVFHVFELNGENPHAERHKFQDQGVSPHST